MKNNILKKIYNKRITSKFAYLRSTTNIHGATDVLIQRRFTRFDLPKLKKSRSSRYQPLKERVWRISQGRPHYSFVHDVALERLQHDMVKRLSIIYDLHVCAGKTEWEDDHHKLYSWDLRDFYVRRKLDTVWVDVLKVQMDKDCFYVKKFRTDLEETRRFLRLIFKFYAEGHANPRLKDVLFGKFEEALDLLDYEENFMNNLVANKKKLAELSIQFLNQTHNPDRNRKNFAYKMFLEEKFMNADVFNPIEMRYQFRFYENRVKEYESKCETAEEKLQKEIDHYQYLTRIEMDCSQWLMTFCFSAIEGFKDRINMLSITYDIEFEKIDNHINYFKIKVEKLREQRKFLTEQLQRFREELEQLREKEMAEQTAAKEAHDRKRGQSEAAKLAKALKKANKLANKKAKQKAKAKRL